jgi:copper chaperone CopZ
VRGVTRAQVRLEEHEAVVTYDPSQATVEQMITAVSKAEGPGPQEYRATVKKEKPASS